MRYLLVFCFGLFRLIATSQEIKSPDEFLGYPLGTKFTPHHRIVDYFEYVATKAGSRVKLEKYGETYEGRPLLIATVSNADNISRMEEIRKNNLRRTGLLKDKPADDKLPIVVWLSYNVHGNEASSSEVSMKMLYELALGKNTDINRWLSNEVVIIDPCLNPDGRERYVNWYRQVEGAVYNANPAAREHDEPWPGGRTNHYNFDLNRDWAWQTQIETKQRLGVYSQWMPQIHCDFHEQMPGNPYYFAPAAEPMHDVITPWQREFQVTMGKNHAKYFDQHGWLYFTREIFDLFYPAYGDTYPLYNGAIGVTYEQAGHGMAGLGIQVNGDTLRLTDRIAHHFTTGMSTLEVASMHAEKLATEFSKFFTNGLTNGNGIYKSYILKGDNTGKTLELQKLFDQNQISYTTAKAGQNIKAYDYFRGLEVSYTTASNDILVSALQPKSALVRVLFEPKSRLSDSLTYDITAWAIPYTYGVQSYACKDKLIAGGNIQTDTKTIGVDKYAFLIRYRSFEDAKMLAALIKAGIHVRIAQRPFTFNGVRYNRGTMIILKSGNEGKMDILNEYAQNYHADITTVSSGYMESGFDFGSEKISLLKAPRVALITGPGSSSGSAGEIWHLFDQELHFPLTLINNDALAYTDLRNFDVLIIPDGRYKFLSDKDGSAELKTWVRQGGKIIALEYAVNQMATGDWGIKAKKEDDDKKEEENKPSYADIKKYESRERDEISNFIPGAIYRIELDESHPLAFGYPNEYFSLKQNDNIYEFMKEGWNVGVVRKQNQVAGFVGSKVNAKIKDGTVIAVQDMGKGEIVYFADNPVFRSFWENGKLMFANAVFFVGQ
jgi:hypothetical protein